jgi:hypothetical protein
MRASLDLILNMMQMGVPTDPEAQAKLAQAKATIESLKSRITCKLEKTNGKVRLSTGVRLLASELLDLKAATEQSGQEYTGPLLTTNPDGTMHATIPISAGVAIGGMQQQKKEIRIKVLGELLSIAPEGYLKEGNYYIYPNPEALAGKNITVTYRPGFGLDVLLLIAAVIVISVGVGLFLFLRMKKGPPKPPPQPSAEPFSKEEIKKSVQRVIEEVQETGPLKEEPKAVLSEEEQAMVENLVEKLAAVKDRYSGEEVQQVLEEEGFNENIRAEVAKRLYGE